MEDISIQSQIDAINRKLDFILEEIMAQKQSRESREDLISDLSVIGKDAFSHTVSQLDKAGVEFDGEVLAGLLVKLIRNLGNINELMDTFESVHDLIKNVTPIAHQVGLDAINKMAEFERKGYLDFIRELGRVGENITTHFSPADARDLADNIVNILETVKRVTKPDMLVAVNNAIAVYGSLDMQNIEEFSLWKAFREMRSPEMRKGMGFMVNFLKNLVKQQELRQKRQ
ncbi:MAG: DUF1641 domain-containing protein [Bacteroidetes bacterium]|nr:DUF1641 domain-containing protein [Bacteroidota bacterium]